MLSEESAISQRSIVKILPWLMCGLAAIFYCYEYLLRIAPSAMDAELMQAYGITADLFGLLSAYYFFAYTPMQLPVGVMMDKYGPRRVLTFAVFCCALGAALMGLSDSFNLALTGRFLIGFGSAFAFVGVLKLASIWLPPEKFAFIAGLTTTLGMLGAVIGQNTMRMTVQSFGVDQTLLYACLIGFVLLPLIWFVVKDLPGDACPKAHREISYRKLWTDLVAVFANPQIWINGLVGALIILPTTVFAELWGSLFFKQIYNFTPQHATQATSMIFLGWAVGGPLCGFISDSIRRRVPLLILGALLGSLMMLMLVYGPMLSETQLFVFLFLFGVVSSVEIICFAVAKENSLASVAGTAVAMTNFIVVCAGVFQWVVGKLLDISRQGLVDAFGAPIYSVQDFQFAFILLPLSMMLGFVLCFFVKETYCRSMSEE